jgi:hypothetical protein
MTVPLSATCQTTGEDGNDLLYIEVNSSAKFTFAVATRTRATRKQARGPKFSFFMFYALCYNRIPIIPMLRTRKEPEVKQFVIYCSPFNLSVQFTKNTSQMCYSARCYEILKYFSWKLKPLQSLAFSQLLKVHFPTLIVSK